MNQSLTLPCWHCGLPAPQGAFPARTPDGNRDACCPGCAAAIETIYGLGLDDYYQIRQDRAPTPDNQRAELDLALFDIAELLSPHCSPLANGERLHLQLSGLTCAACSWLIEKAVADQPDVQRVSVNLAGMTLTVDYVGQARARDTARRIQQLGYGVSLPGDPAAAAKHRKDHKRLLGRLILAGLGAMQAMMYSMALYIGVFDGSDAVYEWVFRLASFVVATPVVFYAGWPFFLGAWRGIRQRHLTMDTPIALALFLAWGGSLVAMFAGGSHVYFDSAAMFVFFLLVSRWLEHRQRQAIHASYSRLADTLPRAVRRLRGDEPEWVSLRQVNAGDRLLLVQGDVVPVDGRIHHGDGVFDDSALTGESRPVSRPKGSALSAGARLQEGSVTLEALCRPSESQVARIAEQVELAQQERLDVVRDWQRIAPLFTAGVLLLAAATLAWHWPAGPGEAFDHMLAVLVITCPCALALAVPLTLSATLGTALREGVLVASPRQLLRVDRLGGVLFDKTGTLTQGSYTLVETRKPGDRDLDELLAIASALEWNNPHPLARPFRDIPRHPGLREIRPDNRGISGFMQDRQWRICGAPEQARPGTTCLQLCCDDKVELYLWLEDSVREESAGVLEALRRRGLTVRMATGDNAAAAQPVAVALKIDDWRAGLRPDDKTLWLRELQQETEQMMVGDGINDAQAMLCAGVSVATANATSLAQHAAGVYLLRDSLGALPALPDLARRCHRTIRQNLTWALLYNILAVPFAVVGWIPPWAAALGMSASSLLVTLNATRVTRWKSSCY
ncbi:MAG: cadmium-translocating P-type ATPase [Pseudomonadales bacterium]|nr:cadmium-translocating P-type ATPase [Pseudomonadales bacterium]